MITYTIQLASGIQYMIIVLRSPNPEAWFIPKTPPLPQQQQQLQNWQ